MNVPSTSESEFVDVSYATSNFSRSVKTLLATKGPGDEVRDAAGELAVTVPSVSYVRQRLRRGGIEVR